jgi:hypothetical protein
MEAIAGTGRRGSHFSIYKLKDEYTKLVVIVNARLSVDKLDFLHKISSLGSFFLSGKVLCGGGT